MGLTGTQQAYKNARAGVARAGASRVNYYTPIRVFTQIAGSTVAIIKDSLQIDEFLQDQYSTAAFTVSSGTPTVGQSVAISLGQTDGNYLFVGRIQRVSTVYRSRVVERAVTQVFAVDHRWDLNRRLVVRTFAPQSVTSIVTSILTSFTSGFTADHVQGNLSTINGISFDFVTVGTALDQLAHHVGATWYVDESKDVHFFTTDEPTNPQTIQASSVFPWRNLSIEVDTGQIRTRAYVEGGGARLVATRAGSTIGTVIDNGDGLRTRGASDTNDSYVYVDAEVFGFGTSDRVRIDQSLYLPATTVAAYDELTTEPEQVATVTSDAAVGDTTLSVSTTTGLPTLVGGGAGIVQVGHQFLSYSGTSGGNTLTGIPASGEGSILSAILTDEDVILPRYLQLDAGSPSSTRVAQEHVAGAAAKSVRCRNDTSAQSALAALDGSDGVRESYRLDDRDDYLIAAATGDAELVQWSTPITTISLQTQDVNVRVGRLLPVNVGSVNASFRIQRMSISGVEEAGAQFPWRTVEASSQRYDLYNVLARIQGRR